MIQTLGLVVPPALLCLPWDPEFQDSPSPQVVDYYKEACRALENSETASLLGKIQKDWKKLVQMKIYYFAAVAHVSEGELGWGGSPCAPIPPRGAPAASGAALASPWAFPAPLKALPGVTQL